MSSRLSPRAYGSGLAVARSLAWALVRAPVWALVPALVLALAAPAAAENAEAKALFDRARAFVKADNHAAACPLFEQALAIEAGLGTELNLALCWSKIGRLVDAAKLFAVILDKTKTPEQAQRHQIAQDAAKDIAARMPKLQIERGSLPTTATVWVDGTELVDPTEPIPVDPGEHVVEADGATKQTVVAVEGQVAEVVLVAGASETRPDTGPPKPIGWFDGDKRPILLAAGGGALVVVGTITGILTLGKKQDGLDLCGGTDEAPDCAPGSPGANALDSARTFSHVTTGLFVVGGGLIVTGVIWKLQERKKIKPADRAVVTGWLSGSGGGFALERVW